MEGAATPNQPGRLHLSCCFFKYTFPRLLFYYFIFFLSASFSPLPDYEAERLENLPRFFFFLSFTPLTRYSLCLPWLHGEGCVWEGGRGEGGDECRLGACPESPLFAALRAKVLLISLIECFVGSGPTLLSTNTSLSATPTPLRHANPPRRSQPPPPRLHLFIFLHVSLGAFISFYYHITETRYIGARWPPAAAFTCEAWKQRIKHIFSRLLLDN